MVIDAYINGNGGNVFEGGLNIAKFALSVISIFFDIIFMIQHYALYPRGAYEGARQLDNDSAMDDEKLYKPGSAVQDS